MNTSPKNTHPTPAASPGGTSATGDRRRGRDGVWSRGWVPVSVMVVGFAVVMIVSNSIASALPNPVTALLIGPLLAVVVLWLYRVATRRIERRAATELDRTDAGSHVLTGVAIGGLLSAASIGIIALFGGYQVTGWGSVAGALTVIGMMFAIAIAEEVLFRGVIFRLIQGRWGT